MFEPEGFTSETSALIHAGREIIYPHHRIAAILRHVWQLTEEEINEHLSLCAKRRCTVQEFLEVLDRSHSYKHFLPLNRTPEFEVCYITCSYESICALDDKAPLTLSFRKHKTSPIGYVLVQHVSKINKMESYLLQRPLLSSAS